MNNKKRILDKLVRIKRMKLFSIGGTNGSGKDTIGQMMAERHGWLFVSASDILREELRRRGMPIERENLRGLSAEWRRKFGLGAMTDKAVEKFKAQTKDYPGLVIASIRNPGEVDRVHELGGKVIWVDANPKIRYERVFSRKRSTEDHKTYEQFLAEEQAEMHHSGDAATLNMSAVKAKADIFLTNDGGDVEEFKNQAEKALKNYL